ncbi:MAG: lasso peptide biosynthesis B2 protein [Novosphingobium sp.]|nr:lasso peptide biosynthesis B2 protein [Novosphingobium sp.]
MGWKLAPGVGFCLAGEDLIFLDVRRDRYLQLSGERRAAFERLCAREPNDSDAMEGLIDTGLVSRSEVATAIAPLEVEVPDADLAAAAIPRAGLTFIAAAARSLYWARKGLLPGRLAATLDGFAAAKRAWAGEADDIGLAALASVYGEARRWVPVPPRCLVDALALYRLSLRNGYAPTLIFGVRTNPFAAHCWLQSHSAVLTGTAEEAHNYRPVLAI